MSPDDLVLAVDDPRQPELVALIERHLGLMHDTSPPEHVHALPVERLADPTVTFFSVRSADAVLAIGALKELDPTHGELKSMHTVAEARGLGIGSRLLEHLLAEARRRGYRRVSLETGSEEVFAPARRLYERYGFAVCPPFGDYWDNEYSVCMTKELPDEPPDRHRP